MRIGVVSDTHGHVRNTLDGIAELSKHHVECVLHCGDIGTASIVPLFAEWPTHFVFGNCDRDEVSLRRAIADCDQNCHGRFGELNLADRSIALLHSDDAMRFREVTTSGEYDLVCYGHTHQYEQRRIGDTIVLNPGALYRAQPHTIAVVDLASMQVDHFPLANSGTV